MSTATVLRSTSEQRRPRALKTASSYGPYGEPNTWSGSRFRYTGQIALPEAQLYHYKARGYHPRLGRFLQTDPVGYQDDMNLYAYVRNDPLNMSDPTGREGVGSWNNGQCNFDGCRAPAPAQPITANDVAAAVEVAGVIWDVVTLPTGAGSGPEGIVGSRIIAAGIREGADDAAGAAARAICCFVAGTLVETSEGLRPIEEIEVGDLVLSRDEETGETAYKPVTDLSRRHERTIWEVVLTGPDGARARFETTDDHPWWIAGVGWKRTEELAAGMAMVTADGRGMIVESVTETERTANTYNLTVADFETYFVGEQRVLVHNCPPGGGRGANHLRPDERAEGPHSTFRRDADGNVTNTATYEPNARNPTGFDEVSRTDVTGSPHYNRVTGEDVPTPHVQGRDIPGGVRRAEPDEIPRRRTP